MAVDDKDIFLFYYLLSFLFEIINFSFNFPSFSLSLEVLDPPGPRPSLPSTILTAPPRPLVFLSFEEAPCVKVLLPPDETSSQINKSNDTFPVLFDDFFFEGRPPLVRPFSSVLKSPFHQPSHTDDVVLIFNEPPFPSFSFHRSFVFFCLVDVRNMLDPPPF